MLNSGNNFCALRDKIIKYSNSCVVRKKISERNKKTYPTPLQVKWSLIEESKLISENMGLY
jgi:hypothetical protein